MAKLYEKKQKKQGLAKTAGDLPMQPVERAKAFIAAVVEGDRLTAADHLSILVRGNRNVGELATRFGRWALRLADPPTEAGLFELESKLFEAAAYHSRDIKRNVPQGPRYSKPHEHAKPEESNDEAVPSGAVDQQEPTTEVTAPVDEAAVDVTLPTPTVDVETDTTGEASEAE